MILEASLRESTRKKYATHLIKWNVFQSSYHSITVETVLKFLTELFSRGLSYSTINTAKSAISTVLTLPPYPSLGDHPQINFFFRGLFNLRPPKTKLTFVWDVKLVFDMFRNSSSNEELSDKRLTQKLVMLLLLLGGQRLNTIKWFTIDRMVVTDTSSLRNMYLSIPGKVIN